MTSVAMRVDVGGEDNIPHTFLSVTHPNGSKTEYGLAPQNHAKESSYGIAGKGMIEVKTIVAGDMIHEFKFQSPAQQLNDTQYKKLMSYINQSIENPPDYMLPGKWSGGGKNCTNWAIDAWQSAELPNTFGVTNSWAWNPYGQGLFMALSNLEGFKLDSLLKKTSYVDPLNRSDTFVSSENTLLVGEQNNNQIDLTQELFGYEMIILNGQNTTQNFIVLEDLDNNDNFNHDDALYFNTPVSKDFSGEETTQNHKREIMLEIINDAIDYLSKESTINWDDVLLKETQNFLIEITELSNATIEQSDNKITEINDFNRDLELFQISQDDSQILDKTLNSIQPLLENDVVLMNDSIHTSLNNFIPAINQPLHQQLVFDEGNSTIW